MTSLLVKLVVSYLLGSLIGSLIVGRLRGGVDIRELGSGNAGGTNALRTQGASFAFWVMVIDVGKAVLATSLVARVTVPALGADALAPTSTALACGAAAVVGHVWPAFYGLRGGKGAATLLGALAVVAPIGLVPVLVVFVCSLVLSGFVGLSTILATWSLAVYAALATSEGLGSPLFAFAVVMGAFITFTHRVNLQRMRAGQENRFEKAMLFRRRAGT
jgi:glycerol-3-phosphate acyltransferase PlsY